MSKRESIRKEAERRGVSHGKIFRERKTQDLIYQIGEDSWIVYAWRWSGDDTCAKIGKSKITRFRWRHPTTYHPTDDLILIGVMRCRSEKEAINLEKYFLNELKQTEAGKMFVYFSGLP